MSMAILFWIVFIVALIFGGLGYNREAPNRWGLGYNLVIWLLLGLLGWAVFGKPIH